LAAGYYALAVTSAWDRGGMGTSNDTPPFYISPGRKLQKIPLIGF
jgi:hypothetical protein